MSHRAYFLRRQQDLQIDFHCFEVRVPLADYCFVAKWQKLGSYFDFYGTIYSLFLQYLTLLTRIHCDDKVANISGSWKTTYFFSAELSNSFARLRGVKVKRKTVSRQKISDEKKFLQQDLQSCVKSNVKKQKCLCFAAFLDFCSAGKTQVQKARQNIRKHTQCPNSFCLGKNHAKNWDCFTNI